MKKSDRKKLETTPPEEETPFERFERMVRQIVSVPKTEIDRRDAEWRKARKDKAKS